MWEGREMRHFSLRFCNVREIMLEGFHGPKELSTNFYMWKPT
jgi:hypothetical protein